MKSETVRTILLVEDEAIISMVEKASLERYGYDIVPVDSGEKAVAAVLADPGLDLVLMDINLGDGIDGTEAAARILEKRDIPVVFLSSHTEPEIVEKTEKITSYGYIVKNSGITVLDASIKMAFKLFEANRIVKETNDRLETTLDALPDLLFEFDSDGLCRGFHSPHRELLFKPASEITGRNVADFMPPGATQLVMASLREAAEKGFSSGIQFEMDVPAGRKWFELSVSRKPGPESRPLFTVLSRDVTERKKTETALLASQNVLEKTRGGREGIGDFDPGPVTFGDLFDVGEIQKIQDQFAAATGLASIITRPDGTPITSPSNFTRLCRDIIRKTEKGYCNCEKSDSVIGRFHPEGAIVQPCLSGGLLDAGACIVVGKTHIANWLIGQVRDESHREESMVAYADEIGADREAFMEAFREVPEMSRGRLVEIATVLSSFANQLATVAYQNLEQSRFIAERNNAEAGIEAAGRFRQVLLDAVPSPVFYKDAECRYTGCNRAFEGYIGLPRENLVGKTVYDIAPPDLAAVYDRADRDLLANPGTQTYEASVRYADGTRHNVVFNKATFVDPEGRIEGMIGVMLDITERKAMEETLRIKNWAIESAINAIATSDLGGKLVYVNPSFVKLWGYESSEEVIGRNAAEFWQMGEKAAEVMKAVMDKGGWMGELKARGGDGRVFDVQVASSLVVDDSGKPICLQASFSDITERKKAALELKETNEYLNNLIDYANAPIVTWDSAFRITRFNHAFERLTGRKQQEVLGKTLDLLFPDDSWKTSMALIQKALGGERLEGVEIPIRARGSGTRIVIWNSANVVDAEGTVVVTIAQGTDITERTCSDEALRESNEYLESLFNYANAPIIVWNPGHVITRFNRAFEALTGRAAADVIGQPLDILFPREKTEEAMRLIRRTRTGERWEAVELPILASDGGTRTVLWNSATIFSADANTPVATIAQGQDITERKNAEAEVLRNDVRMKSLLDIMQHSSDTIQDFLDYALDQAIALTASKIGYIYHYSDDKKEFVLNTWSKDVMKECSVMNPSTTYMLEKTGLWGEAVRQGRPIVVNDFMADNPMKKGCPDGHVRLLKFMTIPLFRDGKIVGVVGLANKETDYDESDILQVSLLMDVVWKETERKQGEERIKNLLAEKEILLKEVHHRVKNNMTAIGSLIALQAESLSEPSAVLALKDAESRVQSMMLLYKKLYESDDFRGMSIKSYLPSLVGEILSNFPGGDSVAVTLNIGDFDLDATKLQPLGIILNELLTNIMKYAFPDASRGAITIDASLEESIVSLIVADNGIGMPESVDFGNSFGFGLTLVRGLAEQLGGSIRIERGNGTKFVLVFEK